MAVYIHTFSAAEQGQRLDVALASLEGVRSRAQAIRLIESGAVRLNGTPLTSKKRIVLAGDELYYEVAPARPAELVAEDIPLDIRYEDECLLVLSKPAGLVVHPAHGHADGTLVNALIAHCGYENLAQLQGEDRPGIVHRLDKDTSGLMLAAKDTAAGAVLQDGIRTKDIERRYIALLHGRVAPDSGLIDAPLARGGADRQRMVVSEQGSARAAVTTFSVLARYDAGRYDDGYTLAECRLFTGRTHQIRVHAEHIGHAVVGDPLYGSQGRPKAQLGLARQFLHSWLLRFSHPVSGAELEFRDALPDELAEVLAQLAERDPSFTESGRELYGQLL